MNSVWDECPILVASRVIQICLIYVLQKEQSLIYTKNYTIWHFLSSTSPFISLFQEKNSVFIFNHFSSYFLSLSTAFMSVESFYVK